MDHVCAQCGEYRPDKIIDPDGPVAICPDCGRRHPFRQLPLLSVSGANGAGKSTICRQLMGHYRRAVLLDADILWRPEFDAPETGYRDFFETWLRLAKNIGQSGRPVVLFGAGTGVPSNFEPCVERRYFTRVHYLALVCSDEVLAERLRERPAWRGAGEDGFIETQRRFNAWFKHNANGSPPISLLDTTGLTVETSAEGVVGWIEAVLQEEHSGERGADVS